MKQELKTGYYYSEKAHYWIRVFAKQSGLHEIVIGKSKPEIMTGSCYMFKYEKPGNSLATMEYVFKKYFGMIEVKYSYAMLERRSDDGITYGDFTYIGDKR